MPFAVFRRHQRKLLAVFAILAMFGFVLADSLPRLLSPGTGGPDQNSVVVELYNKPVYRSELNEMAVQRNNANRFMEALAGSPIFGDINTRSIVDALILQHEADALRMPTGPDVGREWLKQATNGQMNRDLFEATLSRFGNQVSGEQILSDIANQVRIAKVRQLSASPVVTPLDVFQTYRDQNERISARIVPFAVESFLDKVSEPTPVQAQAFYEKYKDVLPDPTRDTPGFKIPRQVRVEILSIDGAALAKSIESRLTEAELRTYYENHKAEYKKTSELPDDLFANDPRALLTPPQVQSFEDVRAFLPATIAEEKAQAEIVEKFGKLKDEAMIPFADSYHDALDEISEAKKQGEKTSATLPKLNELKDLAKAEGFMHEITPLLARSQAENYGEIHDAEVGLTPGSGGRKFASEFFDTKTMLFEPVEFTDILRRRFLARKIEDVPPRVPPFKEIQSEVNLAWKMAQARPLAEKAANELAEEIRKSGGSIKDETISGHKVITTPPVPKLEAGFPLPNQMFQPGPTRAVEFPQIPNAGDLFREAYFGLSAGKVAVAPDEPKNNYYVLTLGQQIPATFGTLYAPNGEYFRYRFEAEKNAQRRQADDWMARLRADAGLKKDWVPTDEQDRNTTPAE
ncbi:hypothetical protein V5E97_15905 [Singulisphaera sp. Ch08]|uniref:PpiC domain-containing protein n=1 Tax=Singulisphaera sp. Ch08 TaxID=3120278 RepID=A0AAU7CR46_9BACT